MKVIVVELSLGQRLVFTDRKKMGMVIKIFSFPGRFVGFLYSLVVVADQVSGASWKSLLCFDDFPKLAEVISLKRSP